MATWQTIGRNVFEHAVSLDDAKFYRSAVSRYYYAAFSVITFELHRRGGAADFPAHQETPSHFQIINGTLINAHFTHFTQERCRNLTHDIAELYRRRIQSDYSSQNISREFARDAHKLSNRVFRYMDVKL